MTALAMMNLAGIALLIGGVLLMLIAAIGVVRLPDPLQRMHASTKAGTLGTTLVLVGTYLVVADAAPSTTVLTIIFLLFTLPIGAQLLARAAYLSGARLKGVEGDVIGGLKRAKTSIADEDGDEQGGPPAQG